MYILKKYSFKDLKLQFVLKNVEWINNCTMRHKVFVQKQCFRLLNCSVLIVTYAQFICSNSDVYLCIAMSI
jgi:hypothetical protein